MRMAPNAAASPSVVSLARPPGAGAAWRRPLPGDRENRLRRLFTFDFEDMAMRGTSVRTDHVGRQALSRLAHLDAWSADDDGPNRSGGIAKSGTWRRKSGRVGGVSLDYVELPRRSYEC